jgi:hypothetical protein
VLEIARRVCYGKRPSRRPIREPSLEFNQCSAGFPAVSTVLPISRPQPISGVSAGVEAEIMTVYPSIAATIMGRRVGRVAQAIPLKTSGVSWPRLLVALPLWIIAVPILLPLALVLYLLQKVFGRRYVLTNRSLQVRQAVGIRTFQHVPLADVKEVALEELPGQAFMKAADLVVLSADGKRLARLEGVPRPVVFRQTILEARDARRQVEASLKTIEARKR